MSGGLDYGDLPTWLTAVTPVAVTIIEGRRRSRVAELARRVEELVETTETLTDRVLDSEELEELVNRAIESAARTTWQEKREALASVLAAAIDGDDTLVSTSLLLEAALSRLERPHALALRRVAQMGASTPSQLVALWPGSATVVDSLLSVLASEGLIRNIASGTWDGVEGKEKWVVTELGEELLLLLDPDNPQGDACGEIAVRVVGNKLVVTNVGRAVVRIYEVTIAGGIAKATVLPTDARPEARPLAPDEPFEAPFTMIPAGSAVVNVAWMDRRGRHTDVFNVNV